MVAKAPVQPKLNLLALHGGYQNHIIFKQKTGSFRSFCKSRANLHYIRAPHYVTEEEMHERGFTPNANGEKLYKWWSVPSGHFETATEYEGIEETIDLVKSTFVEHGPFDGIIGFSQGGVLAAILCALNTATPTEANPISFKFAIIVSAFAPTGQPYRSLLEERKNSLCPTLQVYGENDAVVDPAKSSQLAELFPNAQVKTHPGGHGLPVTAEMKPVYAQFLDQFVNHQ